MSETTNKLDLKSMNISEDKKNKLKELFPEVFSEDKIDFEKLKLTLGEDVSDSEERFGLQWPGKKDCFKVIQEPSIGTLKPCKEESVNWETTENIFIEGDNLEVLKLLQKSYYGKIKMIYIDPPYNTGGEFIYPDRFQENLDTYLAYTGQVNDEGKKFSTNTETSGRFHTNWLNMMYPRLFLARNLLKNDGVIFISIDDNEYDNLKKVCDEIYGEENFIADIIWQKKFSRANDAAYFSTMHDHILCYSKISKFIDVDNCWNINLLSRGNEIPSGYSNPDNDSRGVWTSVVLSAKSGSENLKYTIINPKGKECIPPDGRFWSVNKNKFDELVKDNRIWFGKNGDGTPRLKTFLSEVQDGLRPNTIWFHNEVGHNQEGRQLLKSLFDDKAYFDSPKPIRLIKHILSITSDKSDFITLDFFSGSCSTAHGVLDLNKQDSGKRKFIMVQLPEPCDEKSEAYKAGYKTIADIGKERIRRVINNIEKEIIEEETKNHGKLELEESKLKNKLDLGFKVFKLDRSNFKTWQGDTENNQIENQLEKALFHIDSNSSKEDILTEIIVKSGFELTVKIDSKVLANKEVFSIENDSLIICLDDNLNEEVIKEIAKLEPARVVCLDSGFNQKDELKANAAQILKSHGVEDFRTV